MIYTHTYQLIRPTARVVAAAFVAVLRSCGSFDLLFLLESERVKF